MLNHRKSDLDRHKVQLELWLADVPPRAERFHRQLQTIRREIEGFQEGWWPWLSEDEAKQIEQRVARLSPVSAILCELISEASRLGERVTGLRSREHQLESPVAEWLQDLCHQWHVQLEDLGRHSDRPAELQRESQALGEVEDDLAQHEKAILLLIRGHKIVGQLGDLEAAELGLELQNGSTELVAQGPSDGWLLQLSGRLEPFEAAAEAIKSPPPKLQSVNALLNELRGWARHLDAMAEVENLEEERGFMAVEWTRRDPAEIDQLEQQARRLLERLTEEARQLRQDKLDRLDKEMQDFFAICQHQPGLEQRLDQLRTQHRQLDRSQLHPRWIEQYEKEVSYFKAIVENYQPDLLHWLGNLADRLETGIRALRAMPLSEDVKRQLREVEYEAQGLGRLESVEAVLQALQDGKILEQRLETIAEQAQREISELAELRRRLIDRQQTLESLAGEVAFSLGDLRPAISALDDGSRPLEEARQDAGAVARQLEEEELRCIEHCRHAMTRDLKMADRGRALLELAGDAVEPPPPITLPVTATLPEAVAAASEAAESGRAVMQGVDLRLAETKERIAARAEELRALAPDSLGPGDRADVEQVLDLMQEDLGGDALDQLAHLLDLLEQADVLTGQLRREEMEVEQIREALLRRWREFKEDHLRRYLPEAGTRVEALIHGLPADLQPLADVRAQLEQASRLLHHLERRARRLAARDVDVAVATLGQWQDKAGGPEHLEMLERVRVLGNRQLPSPTLRLRLRGAARDIQEEIR